jgi:hypothetical protein
MKWYYYLLRLIMLILSWHLFETLALAQWSSDPHINNAICTASNDQISSAVISDGERGAIVTWEDRRSGTYDIYAQRINAVGVVQWAGNGVAICTAGGDQYTPAITSDGAGGAIITWVDFRGGTYSDIYAQRINASGVAEWAGNGVAICTAANSQTVATITSDSAGGAIITWQDLRSGVLDIYAQRINASGVVQWATNGVTICGAANKQEYPTIASDAAGGAIITWQDNRTGNYDIFAQRINAGGTVQWSDNGIAICAEADNQVYPNIIDNGAGDAIITWFDVRSGTYPDIYAQRINASGVPLWTNSGVAICTAASFQQFPMPVSDGAGGAIIAWADYRGGNFDIYAQRVDVSGAALWTTDGVAICTMPYGQFSHAIISDGAGGAIITWQDYRNDTNSDIYAQRINAGGVVQWTSNGIAISAAANDQHTPAITIDGAGGAIITWWDYRNGTTADIYAQQVNSNGQLGVVTEVQGDLSALPESFGLEQNYPNPFNPATTIKYQLPTVNNVTLKVYDVLAREVATLVNEMKQPGPYRVQFDGSGLASGVYYYRLQVDKYTAMKKLLLLR